MFVSVQAHAAYYGVLDDGEILESGKYKLTPDLQALTRNGGLNLGITADMGFQEDFGLRALAGFGKTDVYGGVMFKWMPIPDIESQPAIGVNVGLVYGKAGDFSDLSFRAEPLISKRIVVDQTVITPYASIPVSIRTSKSSNEFIKDRNDVAVQMVLGSQLQVEAYKNLQFIAEIGLDLEKAPGYVSLGAVFYIDRENGFSLQ